jgi:uncharacterized membrane-anchored protein
MKRNLLLIVLALQCAWMLGTVAVQEYQRVRGEIVLLETRPVDPRDMLRGDYVILSYAISRVPQSLLQPASTNSVPLDEKVYVLLEKRGQFHEAVSVSLEQPRIKPGQQLICGTTQYGWIPSGSNAVINIRYGLERYYVPEGTGNPRGKLTVEAVLSKSGRASIKEVFIDGRPYRDVMRDGK